jgi:ABC-type multidrug transport system permease subunit
MFEGLLAIAWKEFLHVVRDPATRFVFIIPVIQLVIFGVAILLEVEHIPTCLVDQDQTEESRTLVAAFRNTETFALGEQYVSIDEVRDSIVQGDHRVGLVIPAGYGRSIMRGETADVLVLVDGSNSSEASAAMNVSRAIGLTLSQQVRATPWAVSDLDRIPANLPLARIDVRSRMLFNPNLRSANFFVPGLVGIILQLITLLLTSFSIVRERENGTFEQLMTTPVGSWGLLLGKIAPYGLIAIIETCLVLTLMVVAFQVPIAGSMLLLAGLSLLFLLTALSMGVIISTIASTQMEAMQLSFLILLPSILLSGFVFPIQSIPQPIQTMTYLIPARYFIEILRGIILRGADLSALWPEAVALMVYTAALLVLGAARFKRRLD